MRWLIMPLLFIAIPTGMVAQSPDVYFNRITTGNGLSHNKVNCIISDRRGFIWLGTDDGLNRYDGHRFTIFRNDPLDSTSISGNIITDLLEDEKGIIWIATADGGLTRYDYRLPPASQFRQYRNRPGDSSSIPVNIINKLVLDKDGFLWLATSGHYVLRFNRATGVFESPIQTGTRTVLSLALGSDGRLWAGRQGGGLLKIDTRSLWYESDNRYADLYADLPHSTVISLYKDQDNTMWYGSWDKVLYRFTPARQQEDFLDPKDFADEATCFDEDNQGNLWIGGMHHGLYVLQKKDGRILRFSHNPQRDGTIASNRVNALYIDPRGMIWVGTNRGLSIHDPSQQQFRQTFLPVPAGKSVLIHDFHEDEYNNLWLATSNGIYIRRPGSGSFEHHPLSYRSVPLSVTKFFRDSRGDFYIGTNYSLFLLDPQRFTVRLLPNTEKDGVMNKIIKSQVVSMAESGLDGSRILLTVPYGHYIAYYDFDRQHWVSRLDTAQQILERYRLADNLIRKVQVSSNGTVWLATAKQGLGEWNLAGREPVRYYRNDPATRNGFSNNHIYDIAEDRKGNLWLSTWGGGLHYFDTKARRAAHISGSGNLLEGIQTDSLGNVWMVSNGHVNKYDPVRKVHTTYLLPDLEKTGGVRGAIFKAKDGNLFVSGENYYIEFNPLYIREVAGRPDVYFTDFRIFNESHSHLLMQKHIPLRYNQNYVTFEFSAPVYAGGTEVQYQYMLQGFRDEWVDLGVENKISFSNLDDGQYTFKVRASNRPGVWSEHIASVQLEIIPPVWRRTWFYLACAALMSALIYALYRYRINELVKRQEIRNKIAQDLHDSIGSTLSSISVYSQVAKIYRQQQKEDQLKEALEKISETSGEMISEMNDIVWAINPRNDRMDVMLQRMESFAKPLLAVKSIAFTFQYDEPVKSLNLDMTSRKNFYLIFKEAINNVLKYAGCKHLQVSIQLRDGRLIMRIRDDGAGFDTASVRQKTSAALSGNGLQNMRLRAKEMKGEVHIDSAPGNGTTVTLDFPIP